MNGTTATFNNVDKHSRYTRLQFTLYIRLHVSMTILLLRVFTDMMLETKSSNLKYMCIHSPTLSKERNYKYKKIWGILIF